MSKVPQELLYAKTHEWIKKDNDNIITLGITDHAQHQLGELVFVELPALKKQIKSGQEVAVVESVKTAADVYSPVDGEVVAVNDKLNATPGMVNEDPYGNGWICKIKMHQSELPVLLDANAYQQTLE